ncbi:OmpA family protein [Candidatus Woesearchaeota archaeon]|nr:OmpA family protein [Candidatus Woesearchaeota archaeon]
MNRRTFLGSLVGFVILSEAEARHSKHPKVKPHPPRMLVNHSDQTSLTLYYGTNDWSLHKNDRDDLRSFLKQHPKASFLVEGYCDKRGTDDFNLELGQKRADGVTQFIQQVYTDSFPTSTSYGESNPAVNKDSKQAYARNRRVVVLPDQTIISRGLTLLEADTYLIDASSSMGAPEKWNAVTKFSYPPHAELYAFNTQMGLQKITSPTEVRPDSGTPLWRSLEQLVEQSKEKTRITVLTDGEDNESKTSSPASIPAKAKKKGIVISTIGIQVNYGQREQLVGLARATKGKFYVPN